MALEPFKPDIPPAPFRWPDGLFFLGLAAGLETLDLSPILVLALTTSRVLTTPNS